MMHVNTAIVGGGQAGLAISRYLTGAGVDHLVLERGAIGERWRSERAGTSRLLTPSWMTRLPGWSYQGSYQGEDPDGFMTLPEVVEFLERYARSFRAPVHTGTTVEALHRTQSGYLLRTSRGEVTSRNVVVATGACHEVRVPGFARRADPRLLQLTPASYPGPERLPDGGVLVVGAGATGVQLAWQLRAAGREVLLAVGRHTRLPRTYRGEDIHRWLDRLGLLRRSAAGASPTAALSAQLMGTPERHDVDLPTLQAAGVVLAGRLAAIEGTRAHFAGDLHQHAADADRRLARLLARIDAYHARREAAPAVRPVAPVPPPGELDLVAAGIATVIWATGYRRRYPWLRVPVLGPDGEILHRHGVTPAPGLYALGLPLQSRRDSTFLDGVGHDARYLARRITARRRTRAARRRYILSA